MDGDRIAALAAVYVQRLLLAAPAAAVQGVQLGIVQTAYANGASTAFLRDRLGLTVLCTNTGVKHLHHAAKEFDVGVYFEANGHGTVLFNPSLLSRLAADLDDQVCVEW